MVLTAGEGVQQRGVRGSCRGRTVLLFGFADLRVALGKFQPDRLRDVRIEPHTLHFTQFSIFQIICVYVCVCVYVCESGEQKRFSCVQVKKKRKTIKYLAIDVSFNNENE